MHSDMTAPGLRARSVTARMACAALLVALATSRAQATPPTPYTPAQQLKNFALSTCLARGFADPALRREAQAAAGAYVEFGSHGPDDYQHAIQLTDTFLARPYQAKNSKSDLTVMKCVDLFHSPELDALATAGRQAQQKGLTEKPGP